MSSSSPLMGVCGRTQLEVGRLLPMLKFMHTFCCYHLCESHPEKLLAPEKEVVITFKSACFFSQGLGIALREISKAQKGKKWMTSLIFGSQNC